MPNKYILAGDVGGTKTSLAMYAAGPGGELSVSREASLPSRRYGGLEEVIGDFLAAAREPIAAAAFGVAGAVYRGVVKPTNLPWTRIEATRLAGVIGCPHVRLLNDLEATAYGALFLRPEQLRTLNQGIEREGNRAVIAAGTGLGQAILFWDGTRYVPSATEGGHADFAPRNQREIEFLQFLLREQPRVSFEHVVSGPGLHNIFRFLDLEKHLPVAPATRARIEAEDPAAVIGEAALKGACRACEEAMSMFVAIYGAQAGNLALTSMAIGGVYVGGGIVTKLVPKVAGGPFVDAFCAKEPFSRLMAQIPVHLILDAETSRLGAARAAMELVAAG